MINLPLYYQHTSDQRIYTWDFTRLLGSAETISTATVTAQTGITAGSASISADNKKVTSKISGGTIYTCYMITCQITTNTPQVINRSFNVQIDNL